MTAKGPVRRLERPWLGDYLGPPLKSSTAWMVFLRESGRTPSLGADDSQNGRRSGAHRPQQPLVVLNAPEGAVEDVLGGTVARPGYVGAGVALEQDVRDGDGARRGHEAVDDGAASPGFGDPRDEIRPAAKDTGTAIVEAARAPRWMA